MTQKLPMANDNILQKDNQETLTDKVYGYITNVIAKSIAIFSPDTATNYLKSHSRLRGYTATKNTPATQNYRPAHSSGAQEIAQAWQAVTNKTRDLERNNSHVAGMKRRFVAALVGEGSWPRPKVLTQNAKSKYEFDTEINAELLRRWEKWAPVAGANGDSIYQLQRLAAGHFFIDGGVLFRKVYISPPKRTLPKAKKKSQPKKQLAIEAIELDHLDTAKDTDTPDLRIVGGKELDSYNRVVAYWLKQRHPAEQETTSIRIPAEEIIDLFDRQRVSEISGISRLAPSVMNFHNIGLYRDDTMKLARTALGYGVFVECEQPEDFFNENEDSDETGAQYDYIIPGGVHYLNKGEKITQVKPENPGTQYEPFVRTELRGASVGSGMSYEAVSNDGSQTNFSGARQMLLFERAMIRYTFAIFEERFYSVVYRWFVEHELYFGEPGLNMPDYENQTARYLKATWSRPKTEWVDPLKDAKAAKEEVAMGANTLTEFCEAAGRDIEEVVATRKYEKELFEKAGLPIDLNGSDDKPENDFESFVAEGGLDKWIK